MAGYCAQIPERLLTAAVRRMPAERLEWGAAMLAELATLRQPFARWQFVLGCARVALFPPRRGEFLMNDRMKHWLTTLGAAALFGLLLTGPLAFMEWWNNSGIRSGEFQFPFLLFYWLWLQPTVFFLAAIPIVRGLRAGEAILAHPVTLALRVIFLAFVAAGWVWVIQDQMPCFLGASNCD